MSQAEKSVRPRQADNSAISAWIDARLARNESYVLWHQQVYF